MNYVERKKRERLARIVKVCFEKASTKEFVCSLAECSLRTAGMDLNNLSDAGIISTFVIEEKRDVSGRLPHFHKANKGTLTEEDFIELGRLSALQHKSIKERRSYRKPNEVSIVKFKTKSVKSEIKEVKIGSVQVIVTTFNINDYADKVNETIRMNRPKSPRNYAGTSFNIV